MKNANPIPQAGEVIQFSYPFVRDTYTEQDVDGSAEVPTWKPGVRFVDVPPEGDTRTYADGIGQQILTVISTHKPGKFPMRVFFTRQWRDPSGHIFGKTCCRVISIAAFQSLRRGYRHRFELVAQSSREAQG